MNFISTNDFLKEIESGKEWIIIFGIIYNIEHFRTFHPGGSKILSSYIGKDATDAWVAMHPDKNYVKKFLKPLEVGSLVEEKSALKESKDELMKEFRNLREWAFKNQLFKSKTSFFLFQYFQIILFEMVAWFVLALWGLNFWSILISSLLIATAQTQAGWSQHDYGHLSVFNSRKLNKTFHQFIVGHLKGASSSWWNFRHNLHHCKPNIIKIDPDVEAPYLFLLGKTMPKEWGKKRRGFMPYNYQQNYFFLFGPSLLVPAYFHYEIMYFILKRRKIRELLLTISFVLKFFYFYGFFFNSWFELFSFYMLARFFESFWFTMVTQMSHLPMEVDRDIDVNWVRQQLKATLNVSSSRFNDWFTGHLNYQIEHHLFPDMPRHNYRKVKPRVIKLCEKFGIAYIEKPLLVAFGDIVRSLRESGQLWYHAYREPGLWIVNNSKK